VRVDPEAVSWHYRQMQILTLPQYSRVAFLHETMLNTVRQAIAGEEKDIRKRLDRVQNILYQLTTTVKTDNEDEENDLANELLLLYDYLYVKLENEDIASMNDSMEVLSVLNETFDKLMKKRK
jgi:flagellin-specific chaperone FliS